MTLRESMYRVKRAIVMRALAESRGNVSEAARNLAIHRVHLDKIIGEMDIDIKQIRRIRDNPELLARITGEAMSQEKEVYSNTYCQGRVEGGMLGTHVCAARIAVGKKLCSDCEKKALSGDSESRTAPISESKAL